MNSNIDLSFVFSKSIAVFKAGFNHFIVLGLVAAAMRAVPSLLLGFGIIPSFVSSILTFLFILINILITISILLHAKDVLENEAGSLNDLIAKSGKVYGGYLGTSILLGLFIVAILLPVMLVAAMNLSMIAIVSVGILCFIGFFYITMHYGFAPTIRVLHPEADDAFSTSNYLVKNARWDVFKYFLLVFLMSILPVVLLLSPFALVLNTLVELGVDAFITPFLSVFTVVFYYELIDVHNQLRAVE